MPETSSREKVMAKKQITARKIVREMLKYRGYRFQKKKRVKRAGIVTGKGKMYRQIEYPELDISESNLPNPYVFIHTLDKFSDSFVGLYNEMLGENDCGIVILRKKPNSYEKLLFREPKLEFFILDELQENISKHILVDDHRLATGEEIDEILRLYTKHTLSREERLAQLPQIQALDAMARFIGANVGDVVVVLRESWTTPGITIPHHCIVV